MLTNFVSSVKSRQNWLICELCIVYSKIRFGLKKIFKSGHRPVTLNFRVQVSISHVDLITATTIIIFVFVKQINP